MSAGSACARAAIGFSQGDDVLLLDLAEAGEMMRAIMHALGRDDVSVVLRRFNMLLAAMEPAERDAFRARRSAAMQRIQRLGFLAPQKLVIDARRREAAHAGSLNAALLGDPPPGYSALDRRRSFSVARATARTHSTVAKP